MSDAMPDEVWIATAGTNHNGPYGIWDLEPKRAEKPGWHRYSRKDAATITELRKEVERLRGALEQVAQEGPTSEPPSAYDEWGDMIGDTPERHAERVVDRALWEVAEIARAALQGETK